MEFRVLGPVGIAIDGQLVPIRSRLQRTLLAMLVADANVVVGVDRIVDVLWDREDWEAGHSRLWFHVSKLRSRLGDRSVTVERSGHGYRLDVEPGMIDAVQFERVSARARATIGDDPATAAQLATSALDMWHGEPYADVGDAAVGPAERIRLDELRLATVELWAEAELRRGRAWSLVPELERLVVDHPFRDGLRLQLMRGLWAQGRRSDALAAFAAARAWMRAELGIEPSRSLQDLARRIEMSRDGPGRLASVGRRDRRYGGDVTVGRDEHIRRLLAVLEPHAAARFVRGEAGAGKSTLLAGLVRRAESARGDLVAIRATCHARTGPSDPFAPLRDIVRRLDGDGAAAPSGMVTEVGAARLAALAPLPVDAGAALDAMEDRGSAPTVGAVADLVRRALEAVTTRAPLLLVVDDLQWSDDPTLDVISRLVTRGADGLGLVVAYRPHEPRAPRVERLQRELQTGSPTPVVVDLDRATPRERRVFVDALLDREPNTYGEDLRDSLTQIADGHALFTVELIDDLVRRGAIRWRDGAFEHVGGVDVEAWPVRLHAVIASRFGPIDPPVMDLLRAASVEGETFTSSVVARAVGRDEDEVVAALVHDAVDLHQVVVPIGLGLLAGEPVQRFRFRHQLFHRHVHDELGVVERARLHGTVAAVIAELTDGHDGDEWALALAHHHEEAGELAAAVDQLLRAARRAVRLGANELAVQHLEHGLELLDRTDPGATGDTTEAQLQLELGTARAISDGFSAPSVEASFVRSSTLLDAAPPRDRFRALFGLWSVAVTRGEMDRAAQHAAVLTSMADDLDDAGLRLAAMHALWTQQLFHADLDGCLATVEASLPAYRRDRDHQLGLRYGNHDPAVCGRGLGALAAALAGDMVRAERLRSEAVELATVLDHGPSMIQSLALHCWTSKLTGNTAGVMADAERCLEFEEVGAVPLWFGLARSFASWATVVHGHDPAPLAVLEREVARQARMRTRSWAAVYASLLADAYTAVGRPADARRAVDATRLPDSPFYRCELTRARAEAAHGLGETAVAVDLLLRAIDEARAWGAATLVLRSAVVLARVAPDVATPHVATALTLQPAGSQSPLRTAAEAVIDT